MLRSVIILLALACSQQVRARHVYPFHYQGVMPSMVRMIDDPRQVGTEDEIIIPPRYTSRNGILKTHDFYPQDDSPVLSNRGVGALLPPPARVSFQNPNLRPVQAAAIPVFNQDTENIYPDYSLVGQLDCTSVGSNKNEAMDQWCVLNCNHVPSFCPPSHCICEGDSKKKKKK